MSLANQMTMFIPPGVGCGPERSRWGNLPEASCLVKSVRLKHEDAPKATFSGSWRERERPFITGLGDRLDQDIL